jgi:hypothetical protein
MSTAMLMIVSSVFILIAALFLRELYFFLHWKQSLNRSDRQEWLRRLTAIRNDVSTGSRDGV